MKNEARNLTELEDLRRLGCTHEVVVLVATKNSYIFLCCTFSQVEQF